ncbi:ABC transporter permease, partial [Flavobacteriales bacterium]|nr:ABC transporter permease [Flavobacteriales bacterium]
INKKYHFDKPLYKQYVYYLNDLSPLSIHGISETSLYPKKIHIYSNSEICILIKMPYLRTSFYQKNVLVSHLIASSFFNTIVLSLTAISIALFFAIPLGVMCAYYKDKIIDKMISSFSVLGMSLPSFLIAVIIAYLFAYKLSSLTGLNITGSLYEINDLGERDLKLMNIILPAITLGIRPMAVIINLIRNALIDEISSDYILLARSKGFGSLYVIVFHALRNSLTSVVTAASGWFAGMFSGAVFVEYIFGWNGLGKLLVDALINVDLPLLMGVILVISTCFIVINILVDLIYIWLDPRVKIV